MMADSTTSVNAPAPGTPDHEIRKNAGDNDDATSSLPSVARETSS